MNETCHISTEADVYAAAGMARKMARQMGFSQADVARIEIVVRELASNIVRYAEGGKIDLREAELDHRRGLEVESSDRGPGIPDLELALQDGYTTGHQGLGSGLPAVRRLMDTFEIWTEVGQGTRVRATRWLRRPTDWLRDLWRRD
ncbi:MAG: anti-sigma regulatory factor [Chloroflexia bacterium]|nr:anti-sigma regulatory factor [Chloroflexia bacterium]